VIRLLPKLRLSVFGIVRLRHVSRVTATVVDAKGKHLYRALVLVTGPGIKAHRVRTNNKGVATFKLKPRKRGKLTFRATKPGFQAAYATLKIK
jgi:hypothetical protein